MLRNYKNVFALLKLNCLQHHCNMPWMLATSVTRNSLAYLEGEKEQHTSPNRCSYRHWKTIAFLLIKQHGLDHLQAVYYSWMKSHFIPILQNCGHVAFSKIVAGLSHSLVRKQGHTSVDPYGSTDCRPTTINLVPYSCITTFMNFMRTTSMRPRKLLSELGPPLLLWRNKFISCLQG